MPHLHVDDRDELRTQLSLVHDCPFVLEESEYDDRTQVWRGTFYRPLWGSGAVESRRRFLLFRRYRVPLAAVTLEIRRVNTCTITHNSRIGAFTFNRVKTSDAGVVLCFNEAMEISFTLPDGLDAELDIAEDPCCVGVGSSFLGVDTGPNPEKPNHAS